MFVKKSKVIAVTIITTVEAVKVARVTVVIIVMKKGFIRFIINDFVNEAKSHDSRNIRRMGIRVLVGLESMVFDIQIIGFRFPKVYFVIIHSRFYQSNFVVQ